MQRKSEKDSRKTLKRFAHLIDVLWNNLGGPRRYRKDLRRTPSTPPVVSIQKNTRQMRKSPFSPFRIINHHSGSNGINSVINFTQIKANGPGRKWQDENDGTTGSPRI